MVKIKNRHHTKLGAPALEPLKILLTSPSFPADDEDWRSVFISHMVNALAQQEHTQLMVWAPPGKLPHNVEYLCTSKEQEWLTNLMRKGGIANLLRQGGWQAIVSALYLLNLLRILYKHKREQADVLHVNWLQSAIPLGKGKEPLLVTVLGSDLKLLELPGIRWILRRVLRNRPSIIAPNAEWMINPLQAQFGDVAKVRLIALGIADTWYSLRRDWQKSKKKWIVVLRLTPAKIGNLFSWGNTLFNQTEHELHLFGPMQEKLTIPDWVFYHGPTHPKALQDIWFPQSAGLISLSQHDEGRPQVMLEAMASALPIIASAIPAHQNLLHHKQTGWLCHSQKDFATAISQLSEPECNEAIGRHARMWVKQNIGTWDDCARRYLHAYRDLLDRRA